MNNPIPDFVTKDFAARCANPRGQMSAYAHRWWTPGVAADVDTGRAASAQCAGCIPPGEHVRVYEVSPETAGQALTKWDNRHARWSTRRPQQEIS
jgi:hypothetical protein